MIGEKLHEGFECSQPNFVRMFLLLPGNVFLFCPGAFCTGLRGVSERQDPRKPVKSGETLKYLSRNHFFSNWSTDTYGPAKFEDDMDMSCSTTDKGETNPQEASCFFLVHIMSGNPTTLTPHITRIPGISRQGTCSIKCERYRPSYETLHHGSVQLK